MKPNQKVLSAIQTYYFNRYRQYHISYSKESASGVKAERTNFQWDKNSDLESISKAVLKQGFKSFQSCAGTFWLTYKTRAGISHTITINEDLFMSKRDSLNDWLDKVEKPNKNA